MPVPGTDFGETIAAAPEVPVKFGLLHRAAQRMKQRHTEAEVQRQRAEVAPTVCNTASPDPMQGVMRDVDVNGLR